MACKKIILTVLAILISNLMRSADGNVRAGGEGIRHSKISLQVLYDVASSEIDLKFGNNAQKISEFFTVLDSLQGSPLVVIDSIVCIRSSSSPEGKSNQNASLSLRRATALEELCRQRHLSDYSFDIQSVGEDWRTLSDLLGQSDLHGREEATAIIDNMPTYVIKEGRIVGGRKKAAMDMWRGRFWWTMHESFFPQLRQATVTIHYSVDMTLEDVQEVPVAAACQNHPSSLALNHAEAPSGKLASRVASQQESIPSKPVFALKTNLLYDAASIISLGFEIPLGQRFSLGVDAAFPWWQNRKNDLTIQMIGGTLEGRYWFGNRADREPMTGFFGGVYAGAGYFDFQLGRLTSGRGVQGDFYIMGGLSAGYAHKISKHLRLEYSLGVGYIRTDFQEYISVKDTKYGDIKAIPYPWNPKRTSGILPSKACVSLVWMFNSRKGGSR